MDNVTPMIPGLLLIIPPILGVIGLRLMVYVGFHSVIKVVTSYIHDSTDGKPRYLNYLSTIEAIIGIGIVWAAFNMFFTDTIDYNTRYGLNYCDTYKYKNESPGIAFIKEWIDIQDRS